MRSWLLVLGGFFLFIGIRMFQYQNPYGLLFVIASATTIILTIESYEKVE